VTLPGAVGARSLNQHSLSVHHQVSAVPGGCQRRLSALTGSPVPAMVQLSSDRPARRSVIVGNAMPVLPSDVRSPVRSSPRRVRQPEATGHSVVQCSFDTPAGEPAYQAVVTAIILLTN
jgi:hypothetical protein